MSDTQSWNAELPTRGAVEGYELDQPERIGPYRVLRRLGEGGFGLVYLVEQEAPLRRRVALKVIKPGMDSRAVIARFEAERQALAVMDHPNVAKVLDAGMTERGLPFFAMEYVKGEPITTYCDRHLLSIRQRLELFVGVCDAVQHAHMKGIIHRDLKPSNVLVAVGESGPLVKVIDFGVAKALSHTLTAHTIFTEHGQLIGTPEYMSPEQAEMGATDIDTRTDVYSLGVLLYELLTGALPFDPQSLRSKGYAEIQRIIREVEPPKPSTRLAALSAPSTDAARRRQMRRDDLAGELRRELDWIPLKALRKDRTQRYRTPSDLADDIRNYLAGRPLAAGPESVGYRLRKFVKRNRGPVLAGMAVLIALCAGIAATLWQAGVARHEAKSARQAQAEQMRLGLAEAEARADANERRRDAELRAFQSRFFLAQFSAQALENAALRGFKPTEAESPEMQARPLSGASKLGLAKALESAGLLLLARDRPEHAVELFREAASAKQEARVEPFDVARSYANCAFALYVSKRFAEAETEYRSALSRLEGLPAEHPIASSLHRGLALCLIRMQRFSEARTLLEQIDEKLLTEAVNAYPPAIRDAVFKYVTREEMLAELYEEWHRAEPGRGYDAKSAEWRARLTQSQAATQPASNPVK